MTDSLNIKTGEKRILINDDTNKVLVFNPDDIVFAEKFYELLTDFKISEQNFIERAKELETITETDDLGIPINAKERIELVKELCSWARDKIDYLFGEGTSQMIFGDSYNIDMIVQFFNGIAPFFEKSRSEKMDRYRKVVSDRKKIEENKAAME